MYKHVIIPHVPLKAHNNINLHNHNFPPFFVFVSSEINSCILNVFKFVTQTLTWGVCNHIFFLCFFQQYGAKDTTMNYMKHLINKKLLITSTSMD